MNRDKEVPVTTPRNAEKIRWLVAGAVAALLGGALPASAPAATAPTHFLGGTVINVAAHTPTKRVEVIVRFNRNVTRKQALATIKAAHGKVTREVSFINSYGAVLPAGKAKSLAKARGVATVTVNAKVRSSATTPTLNLPIGKLMTYTQTIGAQAAWPQTLFGAGVGVAVIDSGIQGDLPDFAKSAIDPTSRVVASAVSNPGTTTADDAVGHGTHVAGLIAGNGTAKKLNDPTFGRYMGVAPGANLIEVKAADDNGEVTELDVLDGLDFVIQHKADLGIKVVNLSLNSTVAEPYQVSALDAGVEAAWKAGLVVVAAAGNRGSDADAVNYAPANDPFVITVGGTDELGTPSPKDDTLASWSSRGTTQDGFAKPEVVAPGAHLISLAAPNSLFDTLCPACMFGGGYFQMGGTSMATGVVSGAVALIVKAHPTWTPDQVKSALIATATATPAGPEIAVNKAMTAKGTDLARPNSYAPNTLLDGSGFGVAVDPSKSSWSKSSWSKSSWSKSSWSKSSWSSADAGTDGAGLSRSSWSKSAWSKSAWSSVAVNR
jgi:serine protease AprX